MPTFTISSPQSSGKYRQTNQVEIHDPSLSRCYIANNVLRQIVIFQRVITFKNQNIKDVRFDLTTELGLLHEGPNNSFKCTFFFNESFTGFTEVNGMQYQAQTVGLKFALRKSRYQINAD